MHPKDIHFILSRNLNVIRGVTYLQSSFYFIVAEKQESKTKKKGEYVEYK